MSKVFIDTNILIYALDSHSKEKQEKCRTVLRKTETDIDGVISTQVLQEFYITATKKLGADPLIIKEIMRSFERFEIVVTTPEIIKDAIDCSILNRFSFWDALIIVAAEKAQCERLWSEDLNDGQVVRGVKIENPIVYFP